jgi:hypothetical protein
MKNLKRLGLPFTILTFALATTASAATYGIFTDENGITTQSYSIINGTAKVENTDYTSSAIQDSLRFKSSGVATSTATTDANGISSGTTSSLMGSDVSENGEFSFSRSNLRGNIAPSDPTGVLKEDQYEIFARGLLQNDENVYGISSTGEQVSVTYYVPTKLMGIINALVRVNVTVEPRGGVTVVYPAWYDLFGKADDKAKLQNQLNSAVDRVGLTTAQTAITPNSKAQILVALVDAMRSQVELSGFGTTTEAILR